MKYLRTFHHVFIDLESLFLVLNTALDKAWSINVSKKISCKCLIVYFDKGCYLRFRLLKSELQVKYPNGLLRVEGRD